VQRKHKLKKTLLVCLIAASVIAAALVYHNNMVPPILLSQDTTYYLPGQKKNCLWIVRLDNDIRDIPGDSSQIRIGIPIAESRGYLGGRIEVGGHQDLFLAFAPPQGSQNKNLVLLTADYSGMATPIKTIRFRWLRSSVITILLFNSRNRCLASQVSE
jgi:hypothetical protein